MRARFRDLIGRLVDTSGEHPFVVLLLAFGVLFGSWTYAYTHFRLNSDLLELLPRDSPGFQAFEHQLGRVGGGSSLIVVAQSPDRKANERFIDALAAQLQASLKEHGECVHSVLGTPPPAPGKAEEKPEDARCGQDGRCIAKCGPDLIAYVESGTKDVRTFFQQHKWLYADLDDLQKADDTLDHQIAIRSGLVSDLESDDPAPAPAPGHGGGAAPAPKGDHDLGMDRFYDEWNSRAQKYDDFPTGYFATPDGTMMGLRIISTTRGLGDAGGDSLLARVKRMVGTVNPASIDPRIEVGYAGDIPNAIEEKDSLVSDAAWATGGAFVLIFIGIVVFFRSPWAPLVIALPAAIGVGVAYSFAMWRYGFVNTSGAFLGAIILGNGINYPIVLLNRYREFRARGMPPRDARREAVLNAFRAELVGSLVASIAYGSLVVTHFRGFNQFGVIGFVGMLLVWISMIPCVPALLVVDEWIQTRVPAWMRDRPLRDPTHEGRGPVMRGIAWITERAPFTVVLVAIAGGAYAMHTLPGFLHDPWEYDWGRLGSRGTKVSGAGAWSDKADKVFGGKMNIAGALMLADSPAQVPLIKQAILDNDAKDPQGRLVAEVATVADLLPGTVQEQKKKLAVLQDIRDRFTPGVMARLTDDERKKAKELMPPEGLKPIRAEDLPPLLRRRFEENDGRVGTVFYVKFHNNISFSDGHILLRIAKTTDNVHLRDGTVVQTASRSTVFAEIIRSMQRDGPLATGVSFCAVVAVILIATSSLRGAFAVIAALVLAVGVTLGGAALGGMKLNFFNFIALPITFGIGSEYPFNIFDRSRLLKGDVSSAVRLSGGAVALCSYTTTIGYSSMLVSDQQALQSFGRLAMSGEIACITSALFVLPALLHAMNRLFPRKSSTPAPSGGDGAGG